MYRRDALSALGTVPCMDSFEAMEARRNCLRFSKHYDNDPGDSASRQDLFDERGQ
jgi:hypothetical protein